MHWSCGGLSSRTPACRAEATRASKAKARLLQRGSFNAWLKQTFGIPWLAKAFLKFPPTAVETLLDNWQAHKNSEEYQDQLARFQETPLEQRDQEKYGQKLEAHRLRTRRRKGLRLIRRIEAEEVSYNQLTADEQELYVYLKSGRLTSDLDEATEKHGFGWHHGRQQMLGNSHIFDHTTITGSQ